MSAKTRRLHRRQTMHRLPPLEDVMVRAASGRRLNGQQQTSLLTALPAAMEVFTEVVQAIGSVLVDTLQNLASALNGVMNPSYSLGEERAGQQ